MTVMRTLACLFIFLFISGCDSSIPDAKDIASSSPKANQRYVELGDLDAIKKRGVLRLARPSSEANSGLPRAGLPMQVRQAKAENFAKHLGLTPEWHQADNFSELNNLIATGQADLIISNLTQTPERESTLLFSHPIDRTKELIVSGLNLGAINTIEQLQNKTIAVSRGTSFALSAQQLIDQHPTLNITLQVLDKDLDADAWVDLLQHQTFDATILDSNDIRILNGYRTDFLSGLAVSDTRNIAWASRKAAKELIYELNLFLTERLTRQHLNSRHLDDWTEIKKRGRLRMITRNGPASYFLWRGELMGYEYELVRHFAKQHKLDVEVVVAPSDADMIDWLKDGRGDLIASGLTISEEREKRGIAFSRYYQKVFEQLITTKDRKPLNTLEDLNGRTLTINPKHHYWQTAKALQKLGFDFELAAAEGMSATDILSQINDGHVDATLTDSHVVDIEKRFLPQLAPGKQLEPSFAHGWAVRQNNPELLIKINSYLNKEYRSKHFNILRNKYFHNERRIEKYQGQRLNSDQLSPFDDLVQTAAKPADFDWRLITAQMYQESKFNPKARSHAGARGLMQVMPRTARELGYKLPFNEKSGINAGIAYLMWTRERFENTLPYEERLWFSLAGYNAGYAHVNDARRLASQLGLDKDIWFDNVELAMLKLSQRKYYRHARFGYVRGREPVNYVRSIHQRYQSYLTLEGN